MYHELFTNQRRLGAELFDELAIQLSLNTSNFKTCLENAEQADTVDADVAYGQSVGVRGTPHFFIGRLQDGKLVKARRIVGAQPFSQFFRVLDSLLQ